MKTSSRGIEVLEYIHSGNETPGAFRPILVGVVGSGNLEVMLEPISAAECRVHIESSARGFGAIWEEVIAAFHRRHRLAGVRVTVHDMGATPAVVSLRLDQAVAVLRKGQA